VAEKALTAVIQETYVKHLDPQRRVIVILFGTIVVPNIIN
jgi:hypothetical protein